MEKTVYVYSSNGPRTAASCQLKLVYHYFGRYFIKRFLCGFGLRARSVSFVAIATICSHQNLD